MSIDWGRVTSAVVFGLVTVAISIQGQGVPHTLDAILSLIAVAVIAAYGKYSSSSSLLALNRDQWTDERRREKQLESINRLVDETKRLREYEEKK